MIIITWKLSHQKKKNKNKINVNCWENEILQERKSDRPVTVTRGLNADGPPTEKQGLGRPCGYVCVGGGGG